eukprot:1192343-Prorocentrum_minimum.AAC.2
MGPPVPITARMHSTPQLSSLNRSINRLLDIFLLPVTHSCVVTDAGAAAGGGPDVQHLRGGVRDQLRALRARGGRAHHLLQGVPQPRLPRTVAVREYSGGLARRLLHGVPQP